MTAIRTGLSALLLLGSWAAVGAGPAAASVPTAEPKLSTGLLAAMQRDLGLDADEAAARLAAEKTATAVEGKARRAAGAAFGGSWFDADTGRLTVA
ncbi:S1 family peptidase, partial [Streptomyces sp. NPDC054847]